jgi:hypothetical protein
LFDQFVEVGGEELEDKAEVVAMNERIPKP